jgi:hypothetical protein
MVALARQPVQRLRGRLINAISMTPLAVLRLYYMVAVAAVVAFHRIASQPRPNGSNARSSIEDIGQCPSDAFIPISGAQRFGDGGKVDVAGRYPRRPRGAFLLGTIEQDPYGAPAENPGAASGAKRR